ncbi:MAG TPA: citramalate synthase [Methanomassiliicoccales archaeon]|nr:citramalate synthase [Methanomassiliicoccales archaeon]
MVDRVEIYDTTLRDGAQTEGVSFSNEDKLDVLARLDAFGIDFVEGGFPASNPKDRAFFKAAEKVELQHAKLVSFGNTMKSGASAEHDHTIKSLVDSNTEYVCLFGKTWDLHAKVALGVSLKENLKIIEDSVSYLAGKGRKVIFDAEHFFDGWKNNHDYAMEAVKASVDAGAEYVVLCDTNGGSLPSDITEALSDVRSAESVKLGMHAHNDGELAVANSLAAVEAGAVMVQGTINGLGERCGNANLCSIIPALQMKMKLKTGIVDLSGLTAISNFVGEVANILPDQRLPYVGRSAFAHKGGVHVSAVLKDPRTYEHVDPKTVGNERRVLVSELAGTSNILAKAKELGIEQEKDKGRSILERLKQMEAMGYQFEAAEASFELLVRRLKGENHRPFKLEGFRIFVDVSGDTMRSEASVRVVDPNGLVEHTASDGNGPVNALDKAIRKALERFYPEIREIRLIDYKVRVIDAKAATEATVRVLIRSTDGVNTWTTVGVSGNIIEASLLALMDSIEYKLLKSRNSKKGQ